MGATAYEEPGRTRLYQDNYGAWRFQAVTREGRQLDSQHGFPERDDAERAADAAGLGRSAGFVVWGDGVTAGAGVARIPLPAVDPVAEAVAAGIVVDREAAAEHPGVQVREGGRDEGRGDPVPQGIGIGPTVDDLAPDEGPGG